MEPKTCIRCRGTRLEPGAVRSTGRIYFRPANTAFWSLRTADVPVEANLCLDCGTVELVADIGKAAALVRRRTPE